MPTLRTAFGKKNHCKFMKNFIILLLILEIFCVSEMRAESVKRVIDGDTIEIENPNPPKEFLQNKARLANIDTPESRSQDAKCKKEIELGLKAKKFTQEFFAKKGQIIIEYFGTEKYGRYLVAIEKDGKDLADELVKAGLAVYYDGGTKVKNWCK